MDKNESNFITDHFINNLISKVTVNNEKCIVLEWRQIRDNETSGYCSKLIRIGVVYQANRTRREIHLVAKIPYEGYLYEKANPKGIYEKEIFMYTSILPRLHSLLGEDMLAPKFYGTDNNQAIILEDLSKRDYSTWPRGELLDFEHAVIFIKYLAKLHATAVKLHDQSTKIFDSTKIDNFLISRLRNKEECLMFTEQMLTILEKVIPDLFERRKSEIEKYKERFTDLVLQQMVGKPDEFKVLAHGDVWTNNLMFKDNKFQEVESMKFIDFQFNYWTNPVVDILYFVITSCPFSFYEKHMDLLLEIYVNSLHKTWKYLQYDHRGSYSLRDLKEDIDRKHDYGLFVATWALSFLYHHTSVETNHSYAENNVVNEKYKTVAQGWLTYFVQEVLP